MKDEIKVGDWLVWSPYRDFKNCCFKITSVTLRKVVVIWNKSPYEYDKYLIDGFEQFATPPERERLDSAFQTEKERIHWVKQEEFEERLSEIKFKY